MVMPSAVNRMIVGSTPTAPAVHYMKKKLNSSGQKDYQRNDHEDRALPYKNWLRTIETDGFFADIDMVKFVYQDGVPTPKAITELTRCDTETIGQRYLDAIIDRWYRRDGQAKIITTLSSKLEVPAYLVCFQKDMKWLWVWSFRRKMWKQFTPNQWVAQLSTL